MTTISIRIDQDLVLQAEREAAIQNRSKNKQLEYWAKLGRIVSSQLNISEAFAIAQGIKTIRLETAHASPPVDVDPDTVFAELEQDRKAGLLPQNVTSSSIYYEASVEHPGYLERIDGTTGKRQTGIFEQGQFKILFS